MTSFISTTISISTYEGLKGFAEVCPLGSAYLDAYAYGVLPGIEEIGRHLIGRDPRQINLINDLSFINKDNYQKLLNFWLILYQKLIENFLEYTDKIFAHYEFNIFFAVPPFC